MAKRNGYGQVEPNHLSAQKTGQIAAQLPAASTIKQLENGQFVKYDMASGAVNLTGEGEWMMVFNEVHTYDERDRYYKDFVMKTDDYNHGIITPRLITVNVNDWFTTNTLEKAGSYRQDTVFTKTYAEKDKLQINAQGFLEQVTSPTANAPVFQVAKVYTLADGQFAIKVQRIK